jgi:hypothetical protein
MENSIRAAGRLAGILGILICIIAVVTRLAGTYYLGGFSIESLLQIGTTGVVVGCFLLLWR